MKNMWDQTTLKPFEGRLICLTTTDYWYKGIFRLDRYWMNLTIVESNSPSVNRLIESGEEVSFCLPVEFNIDLAEPESPSDIYSKFVPGEVK